MGMGKKTTWAAAIAALLVGGSSSVLLTGCRDTEGRDEGYPAMRANPDAPENVNTFDDDDDQSRDAPPVGEERSLEPGTNPDDEKFNSPLSPNGDGDAVDGK